MTETNSVLRARGLRKRYGDVPVLRGVDLDLPAAAVLGLVGLNGSGKTTTIECILGLQDFQQGDISVLECDPGELFRLQGDVVAIFDSPSVAPHLTVRQCLEHARRMCPRPVRSCAEVERLLGIEAYSGYRIRQLSLGNRRRVSIAHGLLGAPRLILLDEPFNGLDAGGVDQVLALIGELNRETGASFLLSSHQLPYLEAVCSHIAILHQGRIALAGALRGLLADTGSRVILRSSQAGRARELLRGDGRVELLSESANDGMMLRLRDCSSEQLVAHLINNDVPVAELIRQRASLDSLFRELTAGEAA